MDAPHVRVYRVIGRKGRFVKKRTAYGMINPGMCHNCFLQSDKTPQHPEFPAFRASFVFMRGFIFIIGFGRIKLPGNLPAYPEYYYKPGDISITSQAPVLETTRAKGENIFVSRGKGGSDRGSCNYCRAVYAGTEDPDFHVSGMDDGYGGGGASGPAPRNSPAAAPSE